MRKISKIAAVIHLIVWMVLLLISVVARICWQAPASADGWDVLIITGLYRFFILSSAAGILTAALVVVAVKRLTNSSPQERGRLDTVFQYVAAAACFFFYAFLILLYTVNRHGIWIYGALWLLCTVVCLVMLVIAAIRRARQKRKA